jgi:hypothetical protein
MGLHNMFGQDYINLVKQIFGANLLLYVPIFPEYKSGSDFLDVSGNGWTATSSGVDLDDASITTLDGRPTVYTNNTTASKTLSISNTGFQAAFNWSTVTAICHARVSSAAIYTDGLPHHMCRLAYDASNRIFIQKTPTNNRYQYNLNLGGTTKSINLNSISNTGFFTMAFTIDLSGDSFIGYYNGNNIGSASGLGTPAVTGLGVGSTIFSNFSASTSGWDGAICHFAVAKMVATPAQIKALSLGV